MVDSEQVVVYLGVYFEEQAARDDNGVLKDRRLAGALGAYESAVISRGEDGHVHPLRCTPRSAFSAWEGIRIGALIGLIFPSTVTASDSDERVSLIRRRQAPAVNPELMEVADALNNGQFALLIVGNSTLDADLGRADLRAARHLTREIEISAVLPTMQQNVTFSMQYQLSRTSEVTR